MGGDDDEIGLGMNLPKVDPETEEGEEDEGLGGPVTYRPVAGNEPYRWLNSGQ